MKLLHALALACALSCSGCWSAVAVQIRMDGPGQSPWTRNAMGQLASSALDCPLASTETRYVGRVRGTNWSRYVVRGCGAERNYWTYCVRDQCAQVEPGVEQRASYDLECPLDQIGIEGIGSTLHVVGCGRSGVYTLERGEWSLDTRGVVDVSHQDPSSS